MFSITESDNTSPLVFSTGLSNIVSPTSIESRFLSLVSKSTISLIVIGISKASQAERIHSVWLLNQKSCIRRSTRFESLV